MRGDLARFWQRGVRLWVIALLMVATMLAVASVAVAADESPPGHLSPAFGPTAGGTSVTISGSGFTGATVVSFGSVAATAFTITTDTQIAATTPAHDTGVAPVSVTRADGTTAIVGGFFFLSSSAAAAPTVASVNPTTGSTAGNTPVVINGSGFQPDAHVTFGGTQATEVHVLADAIMIAMTPAHDAWPVDVVVTNQNGQSGTLGNGFTYATPAPAPAPTITIFDPPTGPASTLTPSSTAIGGESGLVVAILGTGFQPHAAVTFGSVPVDHATVLSSTVIVVTPPAHAAGMVDVVITNPDGQSATLAGGFTYVSPTPGAAPTVTNVDPPTGSTGEHVLRFVTITGSGFQHGVTVKFGDTPAEHAETISATAIVISAPDHAPGTVDVTVTNPDGQSSSLANAYTYLAPLQITGVNPSAGPAAGGTGVANIIIINPNGQHGALSHAFTFTGDTNPPINAALTITQVEPAIGPTAGGARVAIHGAGFKDGVTVIFDSTPGTAVHIINSTLLVVTTPGHAVGTVTVTVSNGSTQSSLDNGYGYIAPPEHRSSGATSAANGPPPAPIPTGGRNPHTPAMSAASATGSASGAPVAPNPAPPQR